MLSAKRAQASTEAVFAVVIVLLMAVVIGFFSSERSTEAEMLSASFSEKSACARISEVINSLSSSSARASVAFSLDLNASIISNTVLVGNNYFDFLGSVASDFNLHSGTVRAFKNSQGVVAFEQIA